MTVKPHYWFPVPPSGDRKIKWWFPFIDDSGRLVWDFPVNIGAGGGGGGGDGEVTFNGITVTYQSNEVTYTPDLWLYRGQRVTYQGDGVTL